MKSIKSLKTQGGWIQYVGAAISAVDAISNMGKSNGMSNSQKDLLAKQAGIAGDLGDISQDQYSMYSNYSDDIYDGLFDEINKGPDYEGAMGRSSADVNQAFDSMEERTERNDFKYGVMPGSGRRENTIRRNGVNRSLALVDSQNTARREEDDKHWARMLTGGDIVQGFMNNSINSGKSAMQGTGSAASGYGNMANQYSRSAGNGLQAAGYLANMNTASNDLPSNDGFLPTDDMGNTIYG